MRTKKFFGNIIGLAEAYKVGMSYSALWYSILAAALTWLVLVGIGAVGIILFSNETIYAMGGLLKLVTWSIFFLGGFIAAYKAGFKGWQHGLWAGIFLGLFSAIFLLEVIPTLVEWELVLFQWLAAAILGTSGGIVGLRYLQHKKDRNGYSFRQAKKERFRQLDRG